MKNKKQKILAIMLALVMCLQYFMPITALAAKSVYVEHVYMDGTECFGYPETFGQGQKVLVGADKKVGFCIQPGVKSANGTHTEITPESIGLTEKDMNRLALIAWYGYRSQKHDNVNYCLTQSLIWQELGSKKRIGIGDYRSDSSMQPWFKKVLDKVDNFHKLPSFAGKTYTVNAGESLKIKDTKGVLEDLHIKKVTGGTAKIDGNTLIITPSGKAETMSIEFNRGLSAEQTATNFVFRMGNTQAVSCLTGKDPYYAYLDVKVNLYGRLELTKYNSDKSSTISGTSFKITGPDGYEKTVKTNAEGKAIVKNLVPGKYKAVETNASNGYLIDVTAHNFTIEPNKPTSVAITNNEPTGTISIRKSDTYGNKVVGAKFDVIAAKDIKNKAGNKVLHAKGSIVDSLTIGEDGTATTKKLPLGSYNLKETFAPEGYLLNKEVKNVVLSYKDQNTAVVVGSAEYENAEPTGKVSLKKVFSNNTLTGDAKLEGATYELRAKEDIKNKAGSKKFYSAGDLVATRVADKEGKMEDITNLPLGKYILKETVASEGCLIDKKEYDVELLYKDQNTAIISKAVTSKE